MVPMPEKESYRPHEGNEINFSLQASFLVNYKRSSLSAVISLNNFINLASRTHWTRMVGGT